MKDIELQTDAFKRYIQECDELSITPDYASAFNAAWNARAAVEADRAQRVPDGFALVPIEPTPEMLNCGLVPTNEGEKFAADLAAGYRKTIWAAMLSAAPAQPAQQEPSEATIAQIDREIEAMLTQVESGSFPEFPAKTLALAKEVASLIVAHHQEPPQQERKPMTYREIADATSEWAHVRSDYTIGIIRAVESHHGIKE